MHFLLGAKIRRFGWGQKIVLSVLFRSLNLQNKKSIFSSGVKDACAFVSWMSALVSLFFFCCFKDLTEASPQTLDHPKMSAAATDFPHLGLSLG